MPRKKKKIAVKVVKKGKSKIFVATGATAK